jgi:glycosyltransferase involved in cell wall biosynthesis
MAAIKSAPSRPSLFAIGNMMVRAGRYRDAALIYEYLGEMVPAFQHHALNENYSRSKLVHSLGKCEAYRKLHVDGATKFQKLLRIADTISVLKDPDLVDACFDQELGQSHSERLLAIANASLAADHKKWLQCVNQYLNTQQRLSLTLRPRKLWVTDSLYLNLGFSKLPPIDGPLVTVCMSCFNAAAYVEHAVRSILNQSYRNLELLIFNDRSTDNSLSVIKSLEREDRRIRVTDNSSNQGTYISRNQAFQQAKGEFFTILDADDFAFPDRLALQIAHLQQNADHVGVLTEWVRMHMDGRFHFKVAAWGGHYQHEAHATLMVRTSLVRERIGYWDSVFFGADTEFLMRLREVFEPAAVPLIAIPTVISLFHESSLTNDPVTGIGERGLSPIRRTYRDSWKRWHRGTHGALYMPFPLAKRLFVAPKEMLARDEGRAD